MAAQQPTGDSQQPPTPPLIHNAALAGAVICPIIMLLPPRRMDWRFLILSGAFSMSASQLAYDYTGRSIHQRIGDRVSGAFSTEMPAAARETQRRLREEKMRRLGLDEAAMRRHEAEKRGGLEKLWYGSETDEDWKKKRWEEDQKALDEGKGLSGIIMDQIKDVMPGSKKEGEKKDGEEKKP